MTAGKRPKRSRSGLGRFFSFLGFLAIFGLVAGALGTVLLFAWVSRDLPSPDKLLVRQVQKSTKIWDRTGQHLLYEIHGDQKRTVVELKDIAPVAIQATIASEDKNFYQHSGFQIQSLARALFEAVIRGQSPRGTSTITQQLVKNAILSPERTINRKVKELILAYQIEQKFTKDQILKMYFNEIPYGSNTYGIESAAQSYFGKSAKDLDPAEAALLCALIKAPTRLSPYGTHTDELRWSQKHILDLMAEQGYITNEQRDSAKTVDILSKVQPRHDAIFAPHFALYVKEQLAEKYGELEVEEGGMNVITTLDYDKQKMAEDAVAAGMDTVKKFNGSNAALLAMDPKTGQVLAMVGSADYFDTAHDGNVNVTLRPRQPGSSFKPIAYSEAFEKGFTPSTVLFDVKTTFPTDTGKPYEPENYDGGEHGPVTMRQALAGSLNLPAVKTLYLAGVDKTLDLAGKMGYTTFQDRSRFGLSLVLGGGEVKLIDHVAAYAIFPNEGVYHSPTSILKVEDGNGKILEQWQPQETGNIISVETARNITDILSDNDARSFIFGQKNYLTLADRPVAAKTGTTNGFHDAWTLGYTPSLAAGVWVGNNDNTAMKNKADGSKVAAPIWNQFMKNALAGTPPESFNKPQPVTTGKPVLDGLAGEIKVKVDKFSGKLASNATPPTAIEERVYRQTHDILYFVDKDNPRGPYPADPAQDPQFSAWEAGVASWAAKNNWTAETPPTEFDDLHTQGQMPTVTITNPSDKASITSRTFHVTAQTQAPRGVTRVEYRLEGALLATARSAPWDADVTVPGVYSKGFYMLRATAYDDIENSASQEITLNVQLDEIPLNFNWIRPANQSSIKAGAFPMYIDGTISEYAPVGSVAVYASATDGSITPVGTVSDPKSNGISVTWDLPPAPGLYHLYATATLTNSEARRFEGPDITIQ